MAIDSLEIEKLANLLAAEAKFRLDYKMYLSNMRKLLIVEGTTDQTFIKKVQGETVDCIVAAKIFRSNNRFRTTPTENINCKNAIVKIIKGISYYPSPLIKYPEDLDKWDLYGLVDKDCDEIGVGRPTPRLFITDTHDLETLMLATDNDLLERLEECEIRQDDIDKAYYISYQLALTRDLLRAYHNELDLKAISGSTREIELYEFMEHDRINLTHVISYINKMSQNKISRARCSKIFTEISKNKKGKKLFENGVWKHTLQDFLSARPLDFWDVINGHDILQLLLFLNEDAYGAFADSKGYRINRSFELSLIAAYDYSQFNKTTLKKEMSRAGLLKT